MCFNKNSLPEDLNSELATLVTEPRQWWHTPLIPALGRQRKMDLCEFKATLGYLKLNQTKRETDPSGCCSYLEPRGEDRK